MDSFKDQHRNFTRDRKLSFPLLMTLLLQKGVKSIQLLLNEMSLHWGVSPVSHSAFSQRRMQPKHTAFIELNQKAVVDVMYGDEDYQTYKGMRVLGIDGSKIMLPSTPSVIGEFGEISYSNKATVEGADSQLHTLQPHTSKLHSIKQAGLPTVLAVRFVRVRLKGQFEVLVTSLCDETLYPTADFKELYRLRWKVETFFSVSYQAKKPAILNM